MKALILALSLLTLPAFGQAVYKCPQPDGSLKYQSTRCPDGTRGRIQIQDNGTVTGVPAADAPTGLRPGEQAILNQVKQREEAQHNAAAAPPPSAVSARPRSVMDSQAWKGNEKIIQESTQTINALNRLRR